MSLTDKWDEGLVIDFVDKEQITIYKYCKLKF
jgi:hypothetical protein